MADAGVEEPPAKRAREENASSSTAAPEPASSTAAPEPAAEDPASRSIMKQIEYYFGESNFPKDKFLMAKVAETPEGWVDLTVIASFNRMKQLVPTGDVAVIAAALRTSSFLTLSEDGTQVKRPGMGLKSVTLGGVEYSSRDEVIAHARELIALGDAAEGGAIPEEGQNFVSDLLSHHADVSGKKGPGVAAIKVGRNPEFPETSCFVLVRSDDSVVDFSYLKCLERIFPNTRSLGGGKRNRGNDSGSSAPKKAPAPVEYEPGKLLVFKSLPEGFDHQSLKEKLGGLDKGCAYVELVPDMPLAYARFNTADEAKAALGAEDVGEVAVLDGDDERQYWEKLASGKGSGGKGKGKGGKGKGGKGKGKGKGKGGKGKGGKRD